MSAAAVGTYTGKTRDCSVAGPLRRACALQNIFRAMSSSARSDRDLSPAALPDPGSFDPKGLLRLPSWRLLSETSAESAPELSTARIDAPWTSPSSELDASVLCRLQESMILQITARTNEPMLLNQKLCDQAQAAAFTHSMATIATPCKLSVLCASCRHQAEQGHFNFCSF